MSQNGRMNERFCKTKTFILVNVVIHFTDSFYSNNPIFHVPVKLFIESLSLTLYLKPQTPGEEKFRLKRNNEQMAQFFKNPGTLNVLTSERKHKTKSS